jgi:RNA polymerase sigma-70 factor (ECF subfamily)
MPSGASNLTGSSFDDGQRHVRSSPTSETAGRRERDGSLGMGGEMSHEMGQEMGLTIALNTSTSKSAVKSGEEFSLIRDAQAGDRNAFEELVRRHDREVLRLAQSLMRSAEDARDVYQESFLRAYRNIGRFRFECSFYTWLYRIVTNVCLDQMRRRMARPEDQAPGGGHDGVETDFFDRQPQTNAHASPEKSLLGNEIGEQIAAAMKHLSPRERMVFEMKHHHGLRLRAIGEMLGTTEETVKNSLFRATRKLRTNLAGIL